jgi:hypothetical protein
MIVPRGHSNPRAALAPLVLVGALVILIMSNVGYVPVPAACPGWIEGTDSVIHHPSRATTGAPASAGNSTPSAWTATTSPSVLPATMPIPQSRTIQSDTAAA